MQLISIPCRDSSGTPTLFRAAVKCGASVPSLMNLESYSQITITRYKIGAFPKFLSCGSFL